MPVDCMMMPGVLARMWERYQPDYVMEPERRGDCIIGTAGGHSWVAIL